MGCRCAMPLPGFTAGLTGGAFLPDVLATGTGVLEGALPPCDWAAVTTHALPCMSCLHSTVGACQSTAASNSNALSMTHTQNKSTQARTRSTLLDKQLLLQELQSAQAHIPLIFQLFCLQMSSVLRLGHTLNTSFLNQHLLSTIEGCLYTVLFQLSLLSHFGLLTVVGSVWQEPELGL